MMRLCGFCPGQYGDLYMMTVAARCLKRAVPDSHLTFVISGDYRECAPLFIDCPDIDRIHILHKSNAGFDQCDIDWINEQKFHHVFNPMQDHDFSHPWWENRHQALEAAHMHNIPTNGDDGKIRLTKWFKPSIGFERHIALSPWPSFVEGPRNPKCIQPEMAQAIVDWILAAGWRVLQVGGPNEPQLVGADKPATDYFTSVRNALGCRAMIMGDSGMNWLLSGYDFPVLGLYSERYFGKEYIYNIQPKNPNAIYLTSKTIPEISLDSIFNSIRLLL